MIKDLRLRLLKLKRYNVELYTIFLGIVLAFEVYACYSLNNIKDESRKEICEVSNEKIMLSDKVDELMSNGLEVLSIKKDGEGYNFLLGVKGDKSEIEDKFLKLADYKIIDYEFDINLSYVEGKVTLRYN